MLSVFRRLYFALSSTEVMLRKIYMQREDSVDRLEVGLLSRNALSD